MSELVICFDVAPVGVNLMEWAIAQARTKYNKDVSGWHAEIDESAWIVIFYKK